MRMSGLRIFAAFGLGIAAFVAVIADTAHAQTSEMPHWRTLRFDEANMRVGPSREYKIEWVYRRRGLPIVVLRQRDGWLLVRDHEGTQGWLASTQTSSTLGGLITGDGLAEMRAEPDMSSAVNFRAEPGVVGAIKECTDTHCELDVDGRIGWVDRTRLWGVGEIKLAE